MKKSLIIGCVFVCCLFTASRVYGDVFYWIGGPGNWSEISHWGIYSGAPYNGGQNYARVPNANDTVIFDDNSGFTSSNRLLTLNQTAVCHDLRFLMTTVQLYFTGISYDISIAGSLELQKGMYFRPRTVYFGSEATSEDDDYSIITNGETVTAPVVFQGNYGGVGRWTTTDHFKISNTITVTGGKWIAADSVTQTGNNCVTFTSGTIDWNGQYIAIGALISDNTNTRHLVIDNATIVPTNNYYIYSSYAYTYHSWTYTGTGSTLSAQGSVLKIVNIIGVSSGSYSYSQPIKFNDQHLYDKIILGTQPRTTPISILTGLTTDTLVIMNNTAITSGMTINVNDVLEVEADCKSAISLSLYGNGGVATINMGNKGVAKVSYVLLQNIGISGSAISYSAISCTDLGGNSGWGFVGNATYFWVGGAGNWTDTLHWASSTGGTPASGCIPTVNDDVIFDENSGFTSVSNVCIINAAANCHNMTWRNMSSSPPALTIQANLNIYGSLELQQGMTVAITDGGFVMKSSQTETITTNGVSLPRVNVSSFSITFDGTGTWTMKDDFTIAAIQLTSGNLVMSGLNINLGSLASNNTNIRSLDIRNSLINLDSYTTFSDISSLWHYVGTNSTLLAEGSHLLMNYSALYSSNTIYADKNHLYNKITFPYNGTVLSGSSNYHLVVDTLILGDNVTTMAFHGTGHTSTNSNPNRVFVVNKYFKADNCNTVKTFPYRLIFYYRDINYVSHYIEENNYIEFASGCDVDIVNARTSYLYVVGATVPCDVTNSVVVNTGTGWRNNVSAGNTYYWVGGAGNWDDSQHWALTSGGTGGTGCIPFTADNVIFDENSGFTSASDLVTVSSVAYCNNMTWHNIGTLDKPTLTMSQPIYANGSIEWQQGMSITGTGTIVMQTPVNITATLKNNGVIMPNLTFSGAGTLNILDDLTVTGAFLMPGGGILNMSNIHAVLGYFHASAGNQSIDIQNSVIELNGSSLPTSNPAVWYISSSTSAISAANSTLILNGSNATYNGITCPVSHIYGNVIFRKTGILNTNLTIDSLFVGDENISNIALYIVGGTTITIKSYIESIDCQNLKTFKSNNTTRANIAMQPGADINMDHTTLSYLNFTGNTPYTVNNCMDGGGNVGLTFGNVGKTYYWVNGKGDWNDLLHWDIVSGGNGNTGCVPLMGDNVIFDQNSGFLADGDTVTISSPAYCKNMIWHNMTYNFPHLQINNQLNIYGSLEWQQNMTVNILNNATSYIRFLSPDTVTITSNGVPINGIFTNTDCHRVEFNSQSGKWIMTDDFQVEGSVIFTDGHIEMNGINVSMGGFWSYNNNTRCLDISNSTVRITGYYYYYVSSSNANRGPYSWYYSGSNGVFYSGGSGLYMATPYTSNSIFCFISNATHTYHKIVLETHCWIRANLMVDTLILKENSGVHLFIYPNITVTVNKYFESLNCTSFNYIGGNIGSLGWTMTGTFVMGVGAKVNVDHLFIDYNNPISGPDAPYKAYRSLNPSNIAGWDVSGGIDVYWVGGAGNWSDLQHWANTSGGTPGSGCMPTAGDNVFFDENSGFHGQTSRAVVVNTAAYCKNMTWQNMDALDKPTMTVNANLNIYGSLELQQGMTINGSYNCYISSNDSVTIKTNGVTITRYIYFNGTGAYKILGDFSCTNVYMQSGRLYMDGIKVSISTFTFTNGSISANNATISTGAFTFTNGSMSMNNTTGTMTSFAATGAGVRQLDMSNAKLTLGGAWNCSGTNITLLADNSRINMNSTGAFTGISTHTYDTIVYMKRGTIANGTVLNTLIFAQGFNGSDPNFAFPAGGTVTINRKIITGGTPCEMVTLTSTSTTPANINVPASAYNIEQTIPPIGFDIHFANVSYIHIVEGADKAKVRLSNQSDVAVLHSLTGNWEIVPYEGLKGVTLGNDTSMWCNATFPIYTDHFYGDYNTQYLWNDNSTANTLIISDFGDYWVKVSYSSTCTVSDTIHVSRDSNIVLSGTVISTGSQAKVSLSTSGRAALDPNPVFVLDSVQPSDAMTGLPIVQTSPDFYFSKAVKAFFSHTDSLSGCSDTFMITTPVIAVNDTSFQVDDTVVIISLLDNDIYMLEAGVCTSASTSLSNTITAQHGTAYIKEDTLIYTPHAGWTGLDSLHYVLTVCGKNDTAAVYLVTVRDTFNACPDVSITMTLPDIPGMTYSWYDSPALGNYIAGTSTYTVTKDSPEDIHVWWIEALWDGSKLPTLPLYLMNGSASTATHISGFIGDTLIGVNSTATLTAQAVSEVLNPVFHWYKEETGGTPFHNIATYTTSALTNDTTFYVAISGDNYCTSTERKAITVHVIPPPEAVNDYFTTLVNTPVICDILTNDIIPSECTNPIIDTLPFSGFGGLKGSLSIANDAVIYTPSTGFSGIQRMDYTVQCGSVISDPVGEVMILVLNPLSQSYYACPDAEVTLGFSPMTNLVLNWYDAPVLGNQISSNANTITRTKDNTGLTQSYWAEPIYNGITYPRIQVDLQPGDCGVLNPVGCAATGTILFKEDFGGNNPSDPAIKQEGINQVVGYTYNGSSLSMETYAICKQTILSYGDWLLMDDHTYNNDIERGYLLQVNASIAAGQFYEAQIDNLCPGMQLYFSYWLTSVNTGSTHKTNQIVLLEDTNGNILAQYYTSDIPDNDPTWKQYGFQFTIPDGQSSIIMKIINNGAGSSGNDFTMDDIEIRLCTPPSVTLIEPTNRDTTLCSGSSFTFSGDYTDDGIFTNGGEQLVYRWEHNISSDINNPAAWLPVTGTQNSTANLSLTSSYQIDSVTLADTGYYRLVVANSLNMGNYYCRAMSEIVHLGVNKSPTFDVKDTTGCHIELRGLVSNISGNSTVLYYSDSLLTQGLYSTLKPMSKDTVYYVVSRDTNTGCRSVVRPIHLKMGVYPASSPTTGASVVCTGNTIDFTNPASEGGRWKLSNPTLAEIVNPTPNSVTIKGLSKGQLFLSYIMGENCTTVVTSRIKIITPSEKPVIIIGIER
jgi:hypothetical protein